jgi:tRNA dimethylallyltransferase
MPAAVPPGHAFFLVGPTASGKTEVAHLLAREMGCDLLSADSMLVYRGMDIGTAKPEPALRRETRYWGLDLVDPGEPFSLALFQEEAARAAAENARQGRGLIVVGGTGLYIRALVEGLDTSPPADPGLRLMWEARVREEGLGPLLRELEKRYPALAAALTDSDRGNSRRLMRALELGAGGVTSIRRGWGGRPDLPPLTGLMLSGPILRARIEERVLRMYRAGLLEEVRRLLDGGLEKAPTACQAIGYAEAIACLSGGLTEAAARAETVLRTWQLARRQRTWFRHQVPVRWIDIEAGWDAGTAADRVRRVWAETGPVRLQVGL